MKISSAELLKRFRGEWLQGLRCLSVRQPWASLIASGEKTMEIRSWSTNYRGPLVICSSLSADPARVAAFGDGPRGMALCVVDLLLVRPAQARDARYACVQPPPDSFSWVLRNPRRISEVPVKGKLNFFVPNPAVLKAAQLVAPRAA